MSRLRHHVSVLPCRLHVCNKERKLWATGPALHYYSPFTGSDNDDLPPPADEGVANWNLSVRLPSGMSSSSPTVASEGGCGPQTMHVALGSSRPPSTGLDCGVEEASGDDMVAAVPSPSVLQGEQAPSGIVLGDEPWGKSSRMVRRVAIWAGDVFVKQGVIPLADRRGNP